MTLKTEGFFINESSQLTYQQREYEKMGFHTSWPNHITKRSPYNINQEASDPQINYKDQIEGECSKRNPSKRLLRPPLTFVW